MELFGWQNINVCIFTEVIWLAEAQLFSNYYTEKQSTINRPDIRLLLYVSQFWMMGVWWGG